MEEAFKRQWEKIEQVLQQNQELAVCLVDVEKLWVAEEQFSTELHGHIEALQVRWLLQGVCTPVADQHLRIRSASVGLLEAGRFPLR